MLAVAGLYIAMDTQHLTDRHRDAVTSASKRYATIHTASQPRSGDNYISHGLLPLGVLDTPTATPGMVCVQQGGRQCTGCRRRFNAACFPVSQWGGSGGDKCLVCSAIVDKAEAQVDRFDQFDLYDLVDRRYDQEPEDFIDWDRDTHWYGPGGERECWFDGEGYSS
eukprot:GDKI01049523.1.p1 GENE.GDKI01049523.1~~GDKI01049523.1.p1  ORF type:complete len:166 (+),score=52.98 GDKI01049523.1:136-633(+)